MKMMITRDEIRYRLIYATTKSVIDEVEQIFKENGITKDMAISLSYDILDCVECDIWDELFGEMDKANSKISLKRYYDEKYG